MFILLRSLLSFVVLLTLLASFVTIGGFVGLRGYYWDLARNLAPVFILLHLCLSAILIGVRLRGRVLFIVLSLLFSLFYLIKLFPPEQQVAITLRDTESLDILELGDEVPTVYYYDKELQGQQVRIFQVVPETFWTAHGYHVNTLLFRRLITYLKHYDGHYLLVAKMSTLPTSQHHWRIMYGLEASAEKIGEEIEPVVASPDTLLSRVKKVVFLQPRVLLFAAEERFLTSSLRF